MNPRNSSGEPSAAIGLPTDGKLGYIVRLLQSNAMVVLSGTRIAEELGITRSEVWRLIEQLRELGVAIAGHEGTGYQLEAVPDLILPDLIAPLVSATIFARRLQHYFRIPSTNTAAMAMATDGAAEGTVLLAEEQTAGRGRGGHSWESAPSQGVCCSAILRPPMAPADALAISLMAGLCVCAAVEEVTGMKPDLRWPNDVMLGEKKFCGILTELSAEVMRLRHLVVGVGINVNQETFPEEIAPIATSLRIEGGRAWSRVQIAAALLQSLDSEYRALVADPVAGRKSIIQRFEQHSTWVRDARVTVEDETPYEGVTAGLDDRGFLLVQTAQGLRTVLSGGVRKL
jgi:BirA family biotin operon repressor/biotin-[acetyl-CoA-carboxylase] ligase